nr:hypothetical protein [Tanacetum cinerariifolium]
MITEPGDPNREVLVNETFHVQTDDELTEKELKQIEADDQAIQTILLGLPEDIYAAVDSYETAQEIWLHNYMQQPMPNPEEITNPTTAMNMALALMAKAFKLNYSTPTNNNQRISSNPHNRQIAQLCMNMGQERQIQMVGGNGGNQFRQYAGQNVGNLNGYNNVQNVRNQNPNGNGNVVAARAEGNATGNNGNQIRSHLDEIKEVNANCILMANLQQALTSDIQTDKAPVYDSDGLAKVHNYKDCYDNEIFNMFTQEEQYTELLEPIPEPHQVPQNDNNVISEVSSVEQSGGTVEEHAANVEETQEAKFVGDFKSLAKEADASLAKHKALELEIKRLLRAVVSHDIISVVQNNYVDETSNLQTELERTKERFENCIIKKENEYAKLWNDWINPFKSSMEEKHVPNKVRARVSTKLITVSQPPVITKKVVNSDSNGLSSTRVDNTKTRRPQPRSNTKNDRWKITLVTLRYIFSYQKMKLQRALCYPKNDHEDIGKLSEKGDIGFFIGYSADSCAYRVFNQRTKKIMEIMNVSFDELSAMAFEQSSSKPRLQSMTSRQISSGLDLTYALSTITTQQQTEGELDLLFKAMYDDYIGGQPSAALRIVLASHAHQVRPGPTTSTSIADSGPTPTNLSSQATNPPNTLQDVDEFNSQQQHV